MYQIILLTQEVLRPSLDDFSSTSIASYFRLGRSTLYETLSALGKSMYMGDAECIPLLERPINLANELAVFLELLEAFSRYAPIQCAPLHGQCDGMMGGRAVAFESEGGRIIRISVLRLRGSRNCRGRCLQCCTALRSARNTSSGVCCLW